jgi:DNA-binding beta-propeller fold protein YncE
LSSVWSKVRRRPTVEGSGTIAQAAVNVTPGDQRSRRRLLTVLSVLVVLIGLLVTLLAVYVINPKPLPDLLPIDVDYEPHYLFSIYEVDQPMGVGLSPDGETIYVTESGGERLVRMFDRDGTPRSSFFAAGTTPTSRSPVYVDADAEGRVYVTDRLQHGIFVFDRTGTYLDTLMDPDDALSEYVATSGCTLAQETAYSFNAFEGFVRCTPPGGEEQTLPFPVIDPWSPLGIRIDDFGRVLVTDVLEDEHQVRRHGGDRPDGPALLNLIPFTGGGTGQESDQLLFPNVAVADSRGRVYVTDGNNGRVSIWSVQGRHLGTIGTGSGDDALSLPRGAAINDRDRLHVVDAVGQNIKVYNVSGDEPEYLFSFGEEGLEDGQFSFPGDIAIDASGRLYVTDRENNRIQVWSY